MLVLGLMSGTSADGIDVALARISGRPPRLNIRLHGFYKSPYPASVRAAILRVAEGTSTSSGEISQLNFRLGELFAQAALNACRRFRVAPHHINLIGSHGQTIYHQGAPQPFLGARVASTLQIAEPAVIAARTAITTVADFRPADMAAGGQGAPLVPFLDYLLYRDKRRGRVALNIGGIANVTVIPRAARASHVYAFDTGPGNMVIDALMSRLTNGKKRYDRDAAMARKGRPTRLLLDDLLDHPFFRTPPPKTAGREQFGQAYAARIAGLARGKAGTTRRRTSLAVRPEDLVATVTLLTPLSILDAFHRWILPRTQIEQLVVSGGGAHNPLIVAQLQAGLQAIDVTSSSRFGVPEDAKEALAFAVLAYESYHQRPANLPGATGAATPAILGKITYAPKRTR